MRSSRLRLPILIVISLAVLAPLAAAETFVVADDLALDLPAGQFARADDGSVRTRDGRTAFNTAHMPGGCLALLQHLAASRGQLEAAPDAPATWAAQRLRDASARTYCRDTGGATSVALLVDSADDGDRARVASLVMAAIDAAIDQPGAPRTASAQIALPGTDLVLTLPTGAYRSDDRALTSASGHTIITATAGRGVCDAILRGLASAEHRQVQPAIGAPPTWAPIRYAPQAMSYDYCRDLPHHHTLQLMVLAMVKNDDALTRELGPVFAAIDSAIPPPVPVAFVAAGVGTLMLPGDRWSTADGVLELDDLVRAQISVEDGRCARWRDRADPAVARFEPARAPAAWFPERARVFNARTYCRDLAGDRAVVAALQTTGADEAYEPDALRLLQAIDDAIAAAPAMVAPIAVVAPLAPTTSSTPDQATASTTPIDADLTTRPGQVGEPATFGSMRIGLAVGSEDASARTGVLPSSRTFLLAQLLVPPHLQWPADHRGLTWSIAASAGGAGDVFIGDAHAGAGYGAMLGPFDIEALVDLGADRTGGGFAPVTGAYLGLDLVGRLELGGALALEGDSLWTSGTDGVAQRVQGSLLVASHGRVFGLGFAYQRWSDRGGLLGALASLAL
jgi:AcrR family transcriptional regulator